MIVGELYNPKKLFTGIFIPESMARLPYDVLSPGAKLLFGRLSWHVSDDGECFPSRTKLAEEIGVSEASVREYLKELEDQKFIVRVRNGPNPNSYDFPWHPILEASLRKKKKDGHSGDDQGKSLMDTGVVLDRHSGVLPIISSLTEVLTEEKYIPPTPSFVETEPEGTIGNDPVIFAESVQRIWNHTKGLKKLSGSDRKIVQERWPEVRSKLGEVSESTLRSSADNFAEWVKTAENVHCPIKIFLKDPASWATLRTLPKTSVEFERPTAEIQAIAEVFPERDYIAEWNAGAPWFAQFRPGEKNGHTRFLDECVAIPDFAERFSEVCEIAFKILGIRGPECGWVNFLWLVSPGKDGKERGWWRLLHDLRWMSVRPKTEAEREAEEFKKACLGR